MHKSRALPQGSRLRRVFGGDEGQLEDDEDKLATTSQGIVAVALPHPRGWGSSREDDTLNSMTLREYARGAGRNCGGSPPCGCCG
eukprot:7042023-Pyramimonas_sp.AAC.1